MLEVSVTRDSKTFTYMGYILIGNEWCKKYPTREKSNLLKLSKSVSNPKLPLLKELEELKDLMKII